MKHKRNIKVAYIVIGVGTACLLIGALLLIHALGNVYSLVGACKNTCDGRLHNDQSAVRTGNILLLGGVLVIIMGGLLLRYSEIKAGKK